MECLYQATGTCDCQEFARVDDATPPSSSLLKNAMIQGVDAVASSRIEAVGLLVILSTWPRFFAVADGPWLGKGSHNKCIIPWFHSVLGFTMLTIPAIMIVWRRQGSWRAESETAVSRPRWSSRTRVASMAVEVFLTEMSKAIKHTKKNLTADALRWSQSRMKRRIVWLSLVSAANCWVSKDEMRPLRADFAGSMLLVLAAWLNMALGAG